MSESNAIAYYVANEQLQGKTALERAQVLQWLSFGDSEILPYASAWVFPLLGLVPFNKNAVVRAKEDTEHALKVLDSALLNNTFLVGERISLADIVVFTNLLSLYQYVLEPSVRSQFVNVNRWFNTILNQPQVSKVVKNFKLADKAIEADPKKYAELQAKVAGGAVSKDIKKEQPKKEKKEKPKKEKEPAEELDEADLALAAEPVSKDPFEDMPKGKGQFQPFNRYFRVFFKENRINLDGFFFLKKSSWQIGTFNFEEFKRVYSNEEESVSLKYFWEKYDTQNYSIWYGEYKYNDELTKVFMSSNLIGGMFQRLDKMRKQSFASVCLFGEDNNSTISGIWLWRGQDLAFTLSPDWQIDYDCYEWKKLDPTTPETKKMVENYFSWIGTDSQGRKFNQGKIFK